MCIHAPSPNYVLSDKLNLRGNGLFRLPLPSICGRGANPDAISFTYRYMFNINDMDLHVQITYDLLITIHLPQRKKEEVG